MVVEDFQEEGFPLSCLLKLAGLARSTYYYISKGIKPGKKSSSYIAKSDGSKHNIQTIKEEIEALLSGEFVDYGYYKTYIYLTQDLGYKIGSCSVYKLMKANGLLKYQRTGKVRGKRNWVKDLVPNPITEFSFLEFDIKYMYVAAKRANVQVLTVLDVYSRWNMGQYINWSIRANDVIALFDEIFQNYQMPKHFIVRNDNGSQFEADIVQQYMRYKGVIQEFTLPATPQQNAHIESYHSILESAVCQRMEFENLENVRDIMNRFREFYNFNRIHGGLGYKSPYKYLLQRNVDMKNPIHEADLQNN